MERKQETIFLFPREKKKPTTLYLSLAQFNSFFFFFPFPFHFSGFNCLGFVLVFLRHFFFSSNLSLRKTYNCTLRTIFLFKHTQDFLPHNFLFHVFLSLVLWGIPISLSILWEKNTSSWRILQGLLLRWWCQYIDGVSLLTGLWLYSFVIETTAIYPLDTHLPSYLRILKPKQHTNYIAMDELCTH